MNDMPEVDLNDYKVRLLESKIEYVINAFDYREMLRQQNLVAGDRGNDLGIPSVPEHPRDGHS